MQRLALLLMALGLGASAQDQMYRLARRDSIPFKKFNPTVLGNLKGIDPETLEEMSEPRSHIFTAEVMVGSPPQVMRCLLDTGSAELWMPSKRCTNCRNQRHFHADKSSTFMPAVVQTDHGMMPVPVEFNYGSGEVVGFLVQDTITLGSRVFPNQSFIIVEQEDLPTERGWDGVCGLGWKQAEKAAAPLYKSRALVGKRYVFSLVPSRDGTDAYFTAGEVPQSSCLPGTTVWAPAEPLRKDGDLSYWLASGDVTFGGTQLKSRFMVDSGTQFLLAPPKHYKEFIKALFPGSVFEQYCGIDREAGNLVVCECAIMESLELERNGLTLSVGGKVFELHMEHLYRRVPARSGGELCLLQVQKNNKMSADPMSVLGALLGLGGPPSRAPPFALAPGLMGGAGGGEQIEEIFHQMKDGSTCTNTLVWVKGKVTRNTTKCSNGHSEEGTVSRRLQMMMPGGILIQEEDPLEDVWVLGGVFLENFVVMLDFENQRLGFAHPSWSQGPAATYVPHQLRTQVPVDDRLVQTGVLGGTAAPASSDSGSSFTGFVGFMIVIGVIGYGGTTFYKKINTRKDAIFSEEQGGRGPEEGLAQGTFEEEDMDAAENNAAE
mmetsp:Transcript_95005/g.205135  ORF Transcript_95005/g.205135 Transcript_95005/m.205135 type:complete len:604 (-) Transcript_95005:221-2032(-)